ncbi:MAG: DEAD/DEAH box helicase family protein [Ruminococcus callidus]
MLAVVDKQPILSPEMLDLVFWLKEMTFCTYYDAVRTILPAGMQVQLVETISLAEPQPDCPLTDAEAHLLFSCGEQRPSRIPADSGGRRHTGQKIVDTLVQKGFLLRQETVKEKTHGQTGIKMLRMAVPPDEVPPVTKTQQKLVRILQETGAVSEKEACYLSGVTTAVAKKLVQNGVVESYTVKPPLHTYAASGQTRQPADIVLSAEQQAVYDRMVAALGEGMHCFLLHGVTGSGKTSVFIRLIDTVVQRGKQVILLVPEIALTPQIVEQFYQLFGNIVAVIHSELSLGQRAKRGGASLPVR